MTRRHAFPDIIFSDIIRQQPIRSKFLSSFRNDNNWTTISSNKPSKASNK